MNSAKQMKAILFVAVILTSLIIVILAFRVNTVLHPQINGNENNKTLVGVITSDSILDQSWGSLAYEGKLKISESFPVEVELISEMETEEKMKHAALDLIHKGNTLIIGHGASFSPVFTELALGYPEVHFVTLNGYATHANQSSFWLNHKSPDYFAGMIASLMTKTNKVAIIDSFGTHVEEMLGFFAGIEEFNPDAEVYSRVVGSWDDEETAARYTQELVDLDVDVIFTRGNAFNRAVIHEVEKAGIYAIGFVDDQAYMAEENVLTSIINDVPQAYLIIMKQYFSKRGIQSGQTILDFKDGVYRIAPFGDMVPLSVQEKVVEQLKKYNRGEFNFDDLF